MSKPRQGLFAAFNCVVIFHHKIARLHRVKNNAVGHAGLVGKSGKI